jgi:hypothetical protein
MSLYLKIYSLIDRVTERFLVIDQQIGILSYLQTSAKSNLVSAINELTTHSAANSGVAYTHQQFVPAALWTINHNLGIWPAVSIFDTGGHEIEADVAHQNSNQLLIRFAIPVAGLARLT